MLELALPRLVGSTYSDKSKSGSCTPGEVLNPLKSLGLRLSRWQLGWICRRYRTVLYLRQIHPVVLLRLAEDTAQTPRYGGTHRVTRQLA